MKCPEWSTSRLTKPGNYSVCAHRRRSRRNIIESREVCGVRVERIVFWGRILKLWLGEGSVGVYRWKCRKIGRHGEETML